MLTMKRKNLLLSTTIDWRRDVVDILPLLQGTSGDCLVNATTTISETERIHFKGTLAALQVVGILMDSAVCAQRGGQPNCGAKEETRSRWWMGQLFARVVDVGVFVLLATFGLLNCSSSQKTSTDLHWGHVL